MRVIKVAVVVSLLLIPTLFHVGVHLFHPELKVGIVLMDDTEPIWGELARQGFENYDDHFEAEVLDHRFYSNDVERRGDTMLMSDIFKFGDGPRLREIYGMDAILFVCNGSINDWDEEGLGVWGKADTETGSAVMTVAPFSSRSEHHDKVIKHIALHEVLHLLGYPHNPWDTSGIMQYARNIESLDLCPMFEAQLSLRTVMYQYGIGLSFREAIVVHNIAIVVSILPAYMAVDMMLLFYFNSKSKGWKHPLWLTPVSALCTMLVLLFLIHALFHLFIPLIFIIGLHGVQFGWMSWKNKKEKEGKTSTP